MKTQRSHFDRQIMRSEQLDRARRNKQRKKDIKKYTIIGWTIALLPPAWGFINYLLMGH